MKCEYKQVKVCSNCAYKICLHINDSAYYFVYQGIIGVSQNPLGGSECRNPNFNLTSLSAINKRCQFFFGRELQTDLINFSEHKYLTFKE